MTSIPLVDLATIIFVLVDDWWKTHPDSEIRRPGRPSALSTSEIVTILLLMDVVPFPSERSFIGFLQANHPTLFPTLPALSQVNRHGRAVGTYVEGLRRSWLTTWAVAEEQHLILDTKPVPVMGYTRSKTRSDFAGSASYGSCASRKLFYYGYKLVTLTTLEGVPVVYDLVPAHTDERDAAMAVLYDVQSCAIWADKGFLGAEWFDAVVTQTGNRVWTPKRRNQQANPRAFDQQLGRARQRIEGTFHELQNTGRHLERLLAKSVHGLATRVVTKMTHHVLKYLLRKQYGIDILTFQVDTSKGI